MFQRAEVAPFPRLAVMHGAGAALRVASLFVSPLWSYVCCLYVFSFSSAFGAEPYLKSIPSDYGTSYFDRLFVNGLRTKRYFLKYYKNAL